MPELDSEAFDDFLGEEAIDATARAVGTFSCYWDHDDGEPVLLGIDLADSSGKTVVVPAKGVRLDERKSYVVLDFTKDKLQSAPTLECGSDLPDGFEDEVFEYFGEEAFDYSRAENRRKTMRRKQT